MLLGLDALEDAGDRAFRVDDDRRTRESVVFPALPLLFAEDAERLGGLGRGVAEQVVREVEVLPERPVRLRVVVGESVDLGTDFLEGRDSVPERARLLRSAGRGGGGIDEEHAGLERRELDAPPVLVRHLEIRQRSPDVDFQFGFHGRRIATAGGGVKTSGARRRWSPAL